MKVWDDVLKTYVEVQGTITPEIGKEIQIDDPTDFSTLEDKDQ